MGRGDWGGRLGREVGEGLRSVGVGSTLRAGGGNGGGVGDDQLGVTGPDSAGKG